MNVDTGEFRALTEQVEHLTEVVEDQAGMLIQTLAAFAALVLPETRQISAEFEPPRLRLVRGDAS